MIKSALPFRYEPLKRCSEDYLLWARIVLSGRPAFVLGEPSGYRYMRAMEMGELDSYRELRDARMISNLSCLLLLLQDWGYWAPSWPAP